jgi:mRNA interferase MazF
VKVGDVILADIRSSDGTFKKRPSLILKILPKYEDLLVCTISSQLHQCINGLDLIIERNSSDFKTSGLIKDSLIRVCYLSIIPKRFNEGLLGYISQNSYKTLINRLCEYLKN